VIIFRQKYRFYVVHQSLNVFSGEEIGEHRPNSLYRRATRLEKNEFFDKLYPCLDLAILSKNLLISPEFYDLLEEISMREEIDDASRRVLAGTQLARLHTRLLFFSALSKRLLAGSF